MNLVHATSPGSGVFKSSSCIEDWCLRNAQHELVLLRHDVDTWFPNRKKHACGTFSMVLPILLSVQMREGGHESYDGLKAAGRCSSFCLRFCFATR